MATEFIMPKLGLTMEEGTILAWLVPDGAEVTEGTAVLTIETDKVESDVESSGNGRLRQLGLAGDTFPCGAVIGMLLADGEDLSDAPSPSAATAPPEATAPAVAAVAPAVPPVSASAPPPAAADPTRLFASPRARALAAERNIDLRAVRGTGPNGRIVTADVEEAASAPRRTLPPPPPAAAPAAPRVPTAIGSSPPATVAARQLADLLGVDLAEVDPDPADGYITRESVARYVRGRLQPASPAPPAPAAASQEPTSVRRLTGMRGTIAKRMHASLQEMAQLTLTMDAEMDAVVADRRHQKSLGHNPGYTDYVIAAAARALRAHPNVNAQVTGDGIANLGDIHVGMAVALDDGLMVPVVRHADRLGLLDLSTETTRLADATRAGKLTLGDLEGGTFSVSALGMFGVDAFTPVVNPPNIAILGVGRLRDDVVLDGGTVTSRARLTLSLTWDHRVIDGAPAAEFCRSIVELLAEPDRLHASA